ncbi:hypothetical protein G5V58_19435 [Nocardioides anomalus]|uniref:Uncharacterized protein n=1 Tax=Nocardioides anomalus TaxID=2712223 RepID=A0A6G6WH47_9ACTN|nr:hypothetical protein [Nocardioides anomalus]QIG44661.1 hypothetical protein G5V58_19435 [Nocardioides anomalus]
MVLLLVAVVAWLTLSVPVGVGVGLLLRRSANESTALAPAALEAVVAGRQ